MDTDRWVIARHFRPVSKGYNYGEPTPDGWDLDDTLTGARMWFRLKKAAKTSAEHREETEEKARSYAGVATGWHISGPPRPHQTLVEVYIDLDFGVPGAPRSVRAGLVGAHGYRDNIEALLEHLGLGHLPESRR